MPRSWRAWIDRGGIEGWFSRIPIIFRWLHRRSISAAGADGDGQRLARAWSQRAADLPLDDPYQRDPGIDCRKAGLTAERPAIAGVFARRLREGMLLQTDPTVIYGFGRGIRWRSSPSRSWSPIPPQYLYTQGLPPTPVPCREGALEAAVHPAAGDALYFVADGQGGHVFSRTLDEHNRAVRRYQLREK